jgi:putative spermidine/putrescine transport system substrate-binding protein
MKALKRFAPLAALLLIALVVLACAPAAVPAPTAAPPTAAPAQPTAAPAEPTAVPAQPTAAPAEPTAAPAEPTSAPSGGEMSMEELVAAATAEGMLTTIALPPDWCNYGAMIESFKAKYPGITVNELDPGAGSAEEIEAIKANKDNKGPQAPDVIDVGLAFGPSAKAEGLLLPYKVSTWDSIPDAAKDPDGYWYGDYYGVLAFEVNKDLVENSPQDWADLLKPEYKGQIALAGDPRTSSQAIQTVYAAALANGGSLEDARPGLDFWAQVHQAGNLIPVEATTATFTRGETPIIIQWDYLALANRDNLAGNPEVDIVIPASGRFGGLYIQAISAYAPHPNAAKLWMEHLYSDEGQLIWLSPPGYCHPIRQPDLEARGVVPADVLAKLPSVEGAVFPSLDQLNTARELITTQWDSVVGADIQEAQ